MNIFGRCRPVVALRSLTILAIAALAIAMFVPRLGDFWHGFFQGLALGVLVALLVSLFNAEVTADISS